MASVLSVTVPVLRHVPEITDPQESRDNKQMKGLVGAELTLNTILLNFLKKLCISEKAYCTCRKMCYIVHNLDYYFKIYRTNFWILLWTLLLCKTLHWRQHTQLCLCKTALIFSPKCMRLNEQKWKTSCSINTQKRNTWQMRKNTVYLVKLICNGCLLTLSIKDTKCTRGEFQSKILLTVAKYLYAKPANKHSVWEWTQKTINA